LGLGILGDIGLGFGLGLVLCVPVRVWVLCVPARVWDQGLGPKARSPVQCRAPVTHCSAAAPPGSHPGLQVGPSPGQLSLPLPSVLPPLWQVPGQTTMLAGIRVCCSQAAAAAGGCCSVCCCCCQVSLEVVPAGPIQRSSLETLCLVSIRPA
jgi:hypothetical protein